MTEEEKAVQEEKAYNFAKKKHEGQKRDDGSDYIEHPCQVAELIYLVASKDSNLVCAAYLHDTIEDTNTSYVELLKEFNKDIADLVYEVTQEGKKDSYGHYFPRLKSQRAIMLKFADRLSNISDLNSWGEKRKAHYLRKSKFWKDGSDRDNVWKDK